MKPYETPGIVALSLSLEGLLCTSGGTVIEEGTFGNAGEIIVDKE